MVTSRGALCIETPDEAGSICGAPPISRHRVWSLSSALMQTRAGSRAPNADEKRAKKRRGRAALLRHTRDREFWHVHCGWPDESGMRDGRPRVDALSRGLPQRPQPLQPALIKRVIRLMRERSTSDGRGHETHREAPWLVDEPEHSQESFNDHADRRDTPFPAPGLLSSSSAFY